MKRIIALLIAAALCLTGCGKPETPVEESDNKKEDSVKIGMSFDSFVIERWQRDRDVFVSTAKELGAQVNVQSANGDVDKQKEWINFVKKHLKIREILTFLLHFLIFYKKKAIF